MGLRLGALACAALALASFGCSSDAFSTPDAGVDAGGGDAGTGVDAADARLDAPVEAGAGVFFRNRSLGGSQTTDQKAITDRPLGSLAGDTLVTVLVTSINVALIPPPGWTEIWSVDNGGCAPVRVHVLKGTVTIVDSGAYSIELGPASKYEVTTLAYGGVATVGIEQKTNSNNISKLALDPIALVPPGALVIAGAVFTQGTVANVPQGMTVRSNFGVDQGRIADIAPTGGSLTTAREFDSSHANDCGVAFQLLASP